MSCNQDRYISVLMLLVLRACVERPAGVTVRQIVTDVQRAGRSQRTARASVSMSIRRAWRRGLIELHGRHVGETLTQRQQRARDFAAAAKANPEAYFKTAVALCGQRWESAQAYIAAKERDAAIAIPKLRVVRATITEQGRELLERLTAPPAVQSIAPDEASPIAESSTNAG